MIDRRLGPERDGLATNIDAPTADPTSPEGRLYALLDTLAAIRIDFGHEAEGKAAARSLGPEKIDGIRKLLDQAIASTKDMIGEMHRTPPKG
jgi:hypothetical protein